MTKSSEGKMLQKGVFTGIIEKDENNNFFCGEYLLDYKMVQAKHAVGDWITIKSVIENPSDIATTSILKSLKTLTRQTTNLNNKP